MTQTGKEADLVRWRNRERVRYLGDEIHGAVNYSPEVENAIVPNRGADGELCGSRPVLPEVKWDHREDRPAWWDLVQKRKQGERGSAA